MKKLLISITIFTGLLLFLVKPVAADNIAGSSAAMRKYSFDNATFDKENVYKIRKAMRNVLERYNSPLTSEVDNFINACREYNLDCYLLPSIAGLESTFGRFLMPGSYNPFGWGGGYIYFDSWNNGFQTVAKGLRNNYINRGAESLEDIGRIYSESPTWAIRVQYFINQFKQEEEKLQLFLTQIPVQL